jgi:hypothetical protein
MASLNQPRGDRPKTLKHGRLHHLNNTSGLPFGGRNLRVALFLAVCGPVFCFWRAGADPGGGDPVSKEYQIKAAFLFNFTKFVEWPPGHFVVPNRPIAIGILGENPFGENLERIVRNRKVNGRTIVVKAVATPAEAADVDVLFAPAGEEPRLKAMVATLEENGVLTVGETSNFAALGGIIDFTLEGDRVRFSINLKSAERARLKLSAQLLKLAAIVGQ